MEIEIIKSELNKWKFPCKGVSRKNNMIVGFSSFRKGVVLNTGDSTINYLYEKSDIWDMSEFEPLEEEEQPIDWDKVLLPIWVEDKNGIIMQINLIEKHKVHYFLIEKDGILYTQKIFSLSLSKEKWLNSLKIQSKGAEFKIRIKN